MIRRLNTLFKLKLALLHMVLFKLLLRPWLLVCNSWWFYVIKNFNVLPIWLEREIIFMLFKVKFFLLFYIWQCMKCYCVHGYSRLKPSCIFTSLVPRPCVFVACSTKFAQRAWARSSCDICHSRIFTSADNNVCRVAYIHVKGSFKLKQVKCVR